MGRDLGVSIGEDGRGRRERTEGWDNNPRPELCPASRSSSRHPEPTGGSAPSTALVLSPTRPVVQQPLPSVCGSGQGADPAGVLGPGEGLAPQGEHSPGRGGLLGAEVTRVFKATDRRRHRPNGTTRHGPQRPLPPRPHTACSGAQTHTHTHPRTGALTRTHTVTLNTHPHIHCHARSHSHAHQAWLGAQALMLLAVPVVPRPRPGAASPLRSRERLGRQRRPPGFSFPIPGGQGARGARLRLS